MVAPNRSLLVVWTSFALTAITLAREPIDRLYGPGRPKEWTAELEDVCFAAQESGTPLPSLFGVLFTRRTFVVSLDAGSGRLTLGALPYRQDAWYPPDEPGEI